MAAIIVILLFVGFLFIMIKIGSLQNRAMQHILKNTGISSSDTSAGIEGEFEKKYLKNFLNDNPNYTEDKFRELFKEYSQNIITKNDKGKFSLEVREKMKTDPKLEKMQNMTYRRSAISYYGNGRITVKVIYSDGKDEHELVLQCRIIDNEINVENYKIIKGAVIGF